MKDCNQSLFPGDSHCVCEPTLDDWRSPTQCTLIVAKAGNASSNAAKAARRSPIIAAFPLVWSWRGGTPAEKPAVQTRTVGQLGSNQENNKVGHLVRERDAPTPPVLEPPFSIHPKIETHSPIPIPIWPGLGWTFQFNLNLKLGISIQFPISIHHAAPTGGLWHLGSCSHLHCCSFSPAQYSDRTGDLRGA